MKTHTYLTQKLAAVGLTGIAASMLFLGGCNNGVAGTQSTTPNVDTALESAAPTNAAAHDESLPHSHDDGAESAELGVHARNTKLEVSMQPTTLVPNKMATWTLRVLDKKTGQPVKDFAIEMTKRMHLIVVKSDLSWFNHIHPTYKGNGVFTISAMVPRDGSYKLYADYTPKNGTQEVPQYAFEVGTASSVSPSLVADQLDAKGWMTRTAVSHPEGEPDGINGATYQVALMPMPTNLVLGQDVMLHFQVRDAKGRPVKDLQPYLGTMGHLVVLSGDTNIYLHSHPMSGDMKGMKHDENGGMANMNMGEMTHSATPKSGGPDVVFHTNFPTAGLYKAWGQFKHNGQIITSAFVVNVGTAKSSAAKPATVDESKPHAH